MIVRNLGHDVAIDLDVEPVHCGSKVARAETQDLIVKPNGEEARIDFIAFDEAGRKIKLRDVFWLEHFGNVWDEISTTPTKVSEEQMDKMIARPSTCKLIVTCRDAVTRTRYASVHSIHYDFRRALVVFEERQQLLSDGVA